MKWRAFTALPVVVLVTSSAWAEMPFCLGDICIGKPLTTTMPLKPMEGKYCGQLRYEHKDGNISWIIYVNAAKLNRPIKPGAVYYIERRIDYDKKLYDKGRLTALYSEKYGSPREIEAGSLINNLTYGVAGSSITKEVEIYSVGDELYAYEHIYDFNTKQDLEGMDRKCTADNIIPD